MRKLRVVMGVAVVFALVALTAPRAFAEVEPGGWKAYTPSVRVQRVGCAKITGMTFSLTCGNSHGEQRAEIRYGSYSGGIHQFEGYFKITSMGGARISLKQTFKTTGPFFLLAVDRGGRLYAVGRDNIGTATVGTTVRVNTVHVVGKELRVYLNGQLVFKMASRSGSFYDKIGAYRTASGHGPITVEWSNVRFWQK